MHKNREVDRPDKSNGGGTGRLCLDGNGDPWANGWHDICHCQSADRQGQTHIGNSQGKVIPSIDLLEHCAHPDAKSHGHGVECNEGDHHSLQTVLE